ncbi:DNA polymerase nu [Lissotriton helveticus]
MLALQYVMWCNMENVDQYLGHDIHRKPLSNIAQRIMAAMQFSTSDRTTNYFQSEKNLNCHIAQQLQNECEENTVANLKLTVKQIKAEEHRSSIMITNHLSTQVSSDLHTVTKKMESSRMEQDYQHNRKQIKLDTTSSMPESDLRSTTQHMNLNKANISSVKKNSSSGDVDRNAGPGFLQRQICDSRSLGDKERSELFRETRHAAALVLSLVFEDNSSQLCPGKTHLWSVKGIAVLIKKHAFLGSLPIATATADSISASTCAQDDRYIFLKTKQASMWRDQEDVNNSFTRKMLLLILQSKGSVICFNAKDFLRTCLQLYNKDLSWKQVGDVILFDPRIAAWLIDPNDTAPSFEKLVTKHCGKTVDVRTATSKIDFVQNACENLETLYDLMKELQVKLQVQGLWKLFCTLELPLINILAVMETQKVFIDEDELKKTSEFLGLRLKELEKEAHLSAGQKFRLTSNNDLREVLFKKLQLHLLCTSKKLPKTDLRHLQSTSETAVSLPAVPILSFPSLLTLWSLSFILRPRCYLEMDPFHHRTNLKIKGTTVHGSRMGIVSPALQLNHLQEFHPLPKIILEYRQVHKIKSAFVDGLQSCIKKGYVSSSWNQTGTVSGRLSANHPNIQGVPKLPVQIAKQQYVKGKLKEVVSISPRALFVSSKDSTFLAADFSQIELRILAHFSSDPELLALFNEHDTTDVFTTLASQWKGIPVEAVRPADREQAKRVVYSVVYGAGKERLAECLRVTPVQAGDIIESFLQKYRMIHEFTQKTIHQCRNTESVVSLMGRKRYLPQINGSNYYFRTQAERQAVNFVIQGSAADLCKMAMIKICQTIATSSSLTARLIAQIHDELLFEVDDCQIPEFSALVKSTMESLQQVEGLGVQLKVPLKVSLTVGKSWGSMEEQQL